jgi:hypothetical protein
MSTTIDGVAQILNMYTRKGKAIPAELKVGLGKVSKVLNLIAHNLDKAAEACGYRCVPGVRRVNFLNGLTPGMLTACLTCCLPGRCLGCFVKRMDTSTPITSCDACDTNVLAFSNC